MKRSINDISVKFYSYYQRLPFLRSGKFQIYFKSEAILLIRSIKTIVKEPSKIKTLANFRKHVFSALENYLCNSNGICRKLICAGLNIGYVLFKKDHVLLTQLDWNL